MGLISVPSSCMRSKLVARETESADLLDAVEIESVLEGEQVDGQPEVTEASGAPDAMQVSLGILGEVEVYHNVDGLNVDAASE